MIVANNDFKMAVRAFPESSTRSVRSQIEALMAEGSAIVGPWTKVGCYNFRRNSEQLEVRACFGNLFYAVALDADTAVALVFNVARIVGTSIGRGQRAVRVQLGGSV